MEVLVPLSLHVFMSNIDVFVLVKQLQFGSIQTKLNGFWHTEGQSAGAEGFICLHLHGWLSKRIILKNNYMGNFNIIFLASIIPELIKY